MKTLKSEYSASELSDNHRRSLTSALVIVEQMLSHSLHRTINAKKTKIWEVLSDSKSRKMKGFGVFPTGIAKEYDRDIDELMAIASNIKS